MIGAVGNQIAANPLGEARGAANRDPAVGQQAKSAIVMAREAEGDIPRNAQGVAASAIARGIDPASLFAARVVDETVEPPVFAGPEVEEGAEGLAVDTETGTVLSEAVRDGVLEKPLPSGGLVISEDPSLALLLEPDEQREV